MLYAFGHMGVAAKENIPPRDRRKTCLIILVPMGCKNAVPVQNEKGIIRKNGKGKHHLINLSIAISANAKDTVGDMVQHIYHFLGGISLWQVVSRPVIKDVTEKDELLRALALKSLQKLAGKKCASVDIRCYHIFHIIDLAFIFFIIVAHKNAFFNRRKIS